MKHTYTLLLATILLVSCSQDRDFQYQNPKDTYGTSSQIQEPVMNNTNLSGSGDNVSTINDKSQIESTSLNPNNE